MGDEGKGKIVDVLTSNTISSARLKVDQMQDLE
jgi:adenylosuccinate synthase